jgi:membrane protease YdiL (CAAX protease family)
MRPEQGDTLLAEAETHRSPRVPHLGHALLFLSIAGLLLLASQALILVPLIPRGASPLTISLEHPRLLLATEAGTYAVTLAAAWFTFPLLWHRSFLAGIDWNAATASRLADRLVPLGVLTGWTVQGISSLVSMPKSIPMDDFFRSPADLWIVTLFGTLLAPLFEEIAFRGFLLPATATALDGLIPFLRFARAHTLARLRNQDPPAPAQLVREDAAAFDEDRGNLTGHKAPAIVAAGLLTSALFAVLHAQQLGYTWPAVSLLACVSLVLTVVRIRTRSVACSTLVHASYNLSVFLTLFVATGGYRHLERMTR